MLGHAGAHGFHERARHLGGAAALLVGEDGALDQAADEAGLVREQVMG